MRNSADHQPPTIKDVARKAGVSFKTVSRVINGNSSVNAEMRQAVEQAMGVLGYRPHRAARALRSKRSFTLVLLCGRLPEIDGDDPRANLHDSPAHISDFLLQLIIGCEHGTRSEGYHMILEFLEAAETEAVIGEIAALLEDTMPDGILLSPPICDEPALLDMLERLEMPYARLMPGTQHDRGLCVMTDDYAAGREVGERLFGSGHRDVGFVSGLPNHMAAAARFDGLAMAASAYPDARIRVVAGDFSYQAGVHAAHILLGEEPRPTAIFAANDAMAAGIVNAAAELGLSVPHDLSVVGFDDSVLSRVLLPKLTTIRQPTKELAEAGAKLLIDAVGQSGEAAQQTLRLPYRFIERASTAGPPQPQPTNPSG